MTYCINDVSQDWAKYKIRAGMPPTRRTVEIDMIVVHCTGDEDLLGQDLDSIIYYHTHPNHVCNTGCWSICYHYYIENIKQHAFVHHTVPNDIITFHAGKWNRRSIGLVIDKREKDIPSSDIYEALVDTLSNLCIDYKLNPQVAIFGHRHLYWSGWEMKNGIFLQKKTCPGALGVPFQQLRDDVDAKVKERGYTHPDVLWSSMIVNGEVFVTEDQFNAVSSISNDLIPMIGE